MPVSLSPSPSHPLANTTAAAPAAAAAAAGPPPRHFLNVLSSFAGSMDAHHIQHIAMLAPYRKQVGCWGCLARACRGCVRVRVGPIEWL